jgi:UDP-N-acetylglucosamine 2-epimerase (non-hydrolysing)
MKKASDSKLVYVVAGARPNYVKIAAISRAFRDYRKRHASFKWTIRIVNTGQHYDYLMCKKFFQDLNIPVPYCDLGVGSGTHGAQTALILERFEKLILTARPDLVIVVGDVNSTMGCSLAAVKLGIPVAHVEAGLRSFDREMPEEINRLVTDSIADYLFTSCAEAWPNLRREGVDRKKVFFVGNVMVDSLLANIGKRKGFPSTARGLGLREYAVLTLHRPSNVDREEDFKGIARALEKIQKRIPVIFPVHPRTARIMKQSALGKRLASLPNFHITKPLGYLDFIHLLKRARLVLTDSGGIQEETTVMNVPCVTLRENTERPITLTRGTNHLAGRKCGNITATALKILKEKPGRRAKRLRYWDGKAGERIVRVLLRKLGA